MDSTNEATDQFGDRRAFLHDLQAHDDIVHTDFSRDGFQEIFIEVADGAGFHKMLQDRARSLGYCIEHRCGGVYRLRAE